MTAHLTAAQARALGIGNTLPIVPARKRTTRRAVPRGRAVSVCQACGARFDTDAAETRHVAATLHARYQMEDTVIEWKDPPLDRPAGAYKAAALFAGELRKHPGQWAIYSKTYTKSNAFTAAKRMRSGGARHWMPAGAYETSVVTNDDKRTCTIFARYIGDADVS